MYRPGSFLAKLPTDDPNARRAPAIGPKAYTAGPGAVLQSHNGRVVRLVVFAGARADEQQAVVRLAKAILGALGG
jgi:hypothetical protein